MNLTFIKNIKMKYRDVDDINIESATNNGCRISQKNYLKLLTIF